MSLNTYFQWKGNRLILDVHVQPRARKDEITGVHDGRLKVKITAPPVDGKANQHLIAFFSKLFKVSKGQIVLIAGETGRDKRLEITSPGRLPAFVSELENTS